MRERERERERECVLILILLFQAVQINMNNMCLNQTVCAILVEAVMKKNLVKLSYIWTSGSGGNIVLRHFFFSALVTI